MKLYRIKNRQSFGFSAENPTGQKNGGTKGAGHEDRQAAADHR